MENKLDIRLETQGKEQRIFLEGRLDATWAGHLDDYLNSLVREGSYRFTLNMEGIQYLSSAGIRILVAQYKKVKKIGGALVLESLSGPVADVLDMVGMKRMLTEGVPVVVQNKTVKSEFFEFAQFRFENEVLTDSKMTIHFTGNPSLSAVSGYTAENNSKIKFSGEHYGIGIGAIGEGFSDCKSRYGEFLALGNALVYKPSDGSRIPDYMVKSGKLEPEINALYAIDAQGLFSNRILFEPIPLNTTISLGDLTEGFAKTTGLNQFVFIMIAESAGLVGMNLNTPPVDGKNLFEFPSIRENINFTTEPAYTRMLTVSFGMYFLNPDESIKPFLRPVSPGSAVNIHVHSAVFPFQALSKNETSPGRIILQLFESNIVQDVLHLINDSREIVGLGESNFKQGIAWIGKIS